MTVWPVNHHSGGASKLPQDPHGQRLAVESQSGRFQLSLYPSKAAVTERRNRIFAFGLLNVTNSNHDN